MARGKILRDTSNGDGVIFVNGTQKSFNLEKHWKSGEPPVVGAVVDVELGADGEVASIFLVNKEQLVKEQAQHAKTFLTNNGKGIAHKIISEMGFVVLGCLLAYFVSLVFFNIINADLGFGSAGGTLFQLFKLSDEMDLGGMYGVFFWLTLFAPFAKIFISNRNGYLTYFAPLAFLIILVASYYLKVPELVREYLSLGFGFYLGLIFAGVLAFFGFRGFTKNN